MKLHPESKEITAFTTPIGLFQWQVLPMGMKTLGAVFQRLMDQILGPLQPQCAVVYIDDITVFSKTMEQHLVDVRAVLEKLAKANLEINVDKCSFCQGKVQVLGHIVSKEGVKTNLTLVEGIRQKAPPTKHNRILRISCNGQFL